MPEGTPPCKTTISSPTREALPGPASAEVLQLPRTGSRIDKRAIYLDTRVFTENGWMPYVDPEEKKHWYWIFCSLPCLHGLRQSREGKGRPAGVEVMVIDVDDLCRYLNALAQKDHAAMGTLTGIGVDARAVLRSRR
jgi:hypothetical protein